MQNFIDWLLRSSEDLQFVLYFALLVSLIVAEQFFHYRNIIRKKRWLANFAITLVAILTMMVIPFTFITSAQYAAQHQWGYLTLLKQTGSQLLS